MRALILTSKAEADAHELAMRRRHGIPEDGSGKPGVNIGGGIHAPDAESRTYRYAEVIRHPVADEWAVPIGAADDVEEAKPLDPKGLPKGMAEPMTATAAVVDLGADWFPVKE